MMFLRQIKTCMKLLPSALKSLGGILVKRFPAGSASLKCYRQLVSWLIAKMPFFKRPPKPYILIVAPRAASSRSGVFEYVVQLSNQETLYIRYDRKKLIADLSTLIEILNHQEMGR